MHTDKIVRGSLALLDMPPAHSAPRGEISFVNPLQQLLADAMREAGMPLDQRGSKAELSRRTGVDDGVISNIFNRPRYVPDEDVREALARFLSVSRNDLDAAAAEIKGLRVYPSVTSDPMARLDALSADLLLAARDLSPKRRREIADALNEIAENVRQSQKGRRKRRSDDEN